MNVVIDNSTYLSFKTAVNWKVLDAHTVYNMANFLECLVIADRVFLAPTILWDAVAIDWEHLFEAGHPCAQLEQIAPNRDETVIVFRKAIEESVKDLSLRVIRGVARESGADLDLTRALLQSWRVQAHTDPDSFMQIYSEPHAITDLGAKMWHRTLVPGWIETGPPHEHLAHYLLRCNVAMEISDRVVYHPHSHRMPLVCAKMKLKAGQSTSLVSALIRDTEAEIEKRISATAREALLSPYEPFASVDVDLPLVLAVVLSGAKAPDQIIPRTLDLRILPEAVRYRQWASKLVAAIRNGAVGERTEVAKELLDAKQALAEELTKLYDVRRRTDFSRLSKLVSVVDPEHILSVNTRNALIKAGKCILKLIPEGVGWVKKIQVRRKIALLINLARQRRMLDNLNSLLGRTFGKELSQEQLGALTALRKNQAKLIAGVVAEK